MFWISTILYTHLKCQRAYFWIGFHKEVLLGTRVVTGELSITLSKNSRLARTRQMEPGKNEKLYKEEMSSERESGQNLIQNMVFISSSVLAAGSTFFFYFSHHIPRNNINYANLSIIIARRRVITHKRKVIKKP